jgi:hypothetical protein
MAKMTKNSLRDAGCFLRGRLCPSHFFADKQRGNSERLVSSNRVCL